MVTQVSRSVRVVVTLTLLACGTDVAQLLGDGGNRADAPPDGARGSDAGTADAGTADARPADGGVADAHPADARTVPAVDAPPLGSPDAPQASPPDAPAVTLPDAPIVVPPDAPTGSCSVAAAAPAFPVRLDASRRGLEDQDGQPFYIQGEAAWSLLVRLTATELDTYLTDRRARGFNALIVNLIEHKFGGPANLDGDQPFLTAGDFSTPNDAYFDKAVAAVQRAGDSGFLVLLTPAYLGYQCGDEGWCAELTSGGVAKARAYGHYLGAKLAGVKNIIWMDGGDTAPGAALDEVNAIADELRQAAPDLLHTAHSSRFRSAIDDYDQPWLAINTTYSACSSALTDLERDVARVGDRPSFFVEGTYENEGADLECLIGQAYEALLTGERGHVFGNRPIWLFDPGWPAALDSPGSNLMTHLAALLATRPLLRLVTDGQVVSGARIAARDTGGRTALAYVAGGQAVTVWPGAFTTGGATGWWFDPATGAALSAGAFPAGAQSDTISPVGGPWILVLDDSTCGFGPPGLR